MTREELEIKAIELKEQYMPLFVEEITKKIRELYVLLYEGQRLLGDNDYTDDEIRKLASKEGMTEANIKELEEDYKVENIKNHSTITQFGYNLEENIREMRNASYEILKTLMFDENYSLIKEISGTSNSLIDIKGDEIARQLEEVRKTDNCKYVIRIHNHPYTLAANSDKQDDTQYEKARNELEDIGVTLLDDCIVTTYDFFSRK